MQTVVLSGRSQAQSGGTAARSSSTAIALANLCRSPVVHCPRTRAAVTAQYKFRLVGTLLALNSSFLRPPHSRRLHARFRANAAKFRRESSPSHAQRRQPFEHLLGRHHFQRMLELERNVMAMLRIPVRLRLRSLTFVDRRLSTARECVQQAQPSTHSVWSGSCWRCAALCKRRNHRCRLHARFRATFPICRREQRPSHARCRQPLAHPLARHRFVRILSSSSMSAHKLRISIKSFLLPPPLARSISPCHFGPTGDTAQALRDVGSPGESLGVCSTAP